MPKPVDTKRVQRQSSRIEAVLEWVGERWQVVAMVIALIVLGIAWLTA